MRVEGEDIPKMFSSSDPFQRRALTGFALRQIKQKFQNTIDEVKEIDELWPLENWTFFVVCISSLTGLVSFFGLPFGFLFGLSIFLLFEFREMDRKNLKETEIKNLETRIFEIIRLDAEEPITPCQRY